MTPFDFHRQAVALPKRLAQWAPQVTAAAIARSLNPVFIMAVLDRESNGRSADIRGDGGHGHGLMQLDDRYHPSFVTATYLGKPLWKDAAWNILAGASLLRELYDRFKGNLWAAAAGYNRNPAKVEKALLAISAGASDAEICAAVDAGTTLNNYASDVRRRMQDFTTAMAAASRKAVPNV